MWDCHLVQEGGRAKTRDKFSLYKTLWERGPSFSKEVEAMLFVTSMGRGLHGEGTLTTKRPECLVT